MAYKDGVERYSDFSIRAPGDGYEDRWRAQVDEYLVSGDQTRYAITIWDWYLSQARVPKVFSARGFRTPKEAEDRAVKFVDEIYGNRHKHEAVYP